MFGRLFAAALAVCLSAGCSTLSPGLVASRSAGRPPDVDQPLVLRSAAPEPTEDVDDDLPWSAYDRKLAEESPWSYSSPTDDPLPTRNDRLFSYLDSEPELAPPPESEGGWRGVAQEFGGELWQDATNFYDWETATKFGVGLGFAAIAANTTIDEKFDAWFQNHVRSSATDGVTHNIKWIGDGVYTVPIAASFYLLGRFAEDVPYAPELGQFGDRTLRGYAVGVVPLLVMQQVIGSDRPGASVEGSQWTPFVSSHGVSGDAFMGAIPFLAAAGMVDNPWAKGTLIAASFLPAIGRIDYDMHYLSQAALGWFLAYLSMEAVNDTDGQRSNGKIVPIFQPNAYGVAAEYRW